MTSISQERSRLSDVGMRLRWRSQWGSRRSYGNSRSVIEPATRAFIHISVTNPSSYNGLDAHARAIEAIGMSRFPNTGISYNRMIFAGSDTIWEGQPIGRRGAHTVNDHRRSTCNRWGNACPGNGSSLTAPSWNLNYNSRAYVFAANVNNAATDQVVDNFARVIAADALAGFITESAAHNIHGHRCVSSKSCPGNRLFNRMQDIHSRIDNYLANGVDDELPLSNDDINRIVNAVWNRDGVIPSPNTIDNDDHWRAAYYLRSIRQHVDGNRLADIIWSHDVNETDDRDGHGPAAPPSYVEGAPLNNRWQAQRYMSEIWEFLHKISPQADRVVDLVEAMADQALGVDAQEIKDHIDARADQAASERQDLSDLVADVQEKHDQLHTLMENFDAADISAEDVVDGIRRMLHDATADDEPEPDAEGNL